MALELTAKPRSVNARLAQTSELSTEVGGSNVVAVAGIQRRDELLGPLLCRVGEDIA